MLPGSPPAASVGTQVHPVTSHYFHTPHPSRVWQTPHPNEGSSNSESVLGNYACLHANNRSCDYGLFPVILVNGPDGIFASGKFPSCFGELPNLLLTGEDALGAGRAPEGGQEAWRQALHLPQPQSPHL